MVDVSKLLGGVSEPAPVASGYHERVYTSDFTIAEGPGGEILYDQDAEGMDFVGFPPAPRRSPSAFHFYGRNQPYGIYIPNQSGPHGMQLALHGYSANHASLINNPGMQQNVGEARNRVLVVPLGRGPAGWYNEISEKDVLDVMTDVEANYPIDSERVFAGGYSMGGYGTYRFATLYPHRFAGFIAWVGALLGGGSKGISTLDFFGNLRQVPGAMLYSGADELVNITSYNRDPGAYRPARLRAHPLLPSGRRPLSRTRSHDDWVKESDWSTDRTRQTQPAQVTYRMEPFVWNESLSVIHDQAYCGKRGERARNGRRRLRGRGRALPSGLRVLRPATQRTMPDPFDTDPVPWTAQEYRPCSRLRLWPEPHTIEATLANVASFEIDASDFVGACIAGDQIDYEITTDGPNAGLEFSDGSTLDFAELRGPIQARCPSPGRQASLPRERC